MIKVMIADDQELIRQSLQIVLSTHEDLKVVDAVENGFAVLESIKKEMTGFQGIFFDEINKKKLIDLQERKLKYVVKDMHITFKFGKTEKYPEEVLNKDYEVKIVGYAATDKNSGFQVELPKELKAYFKNENGPHITVSIGEVDGIKGKAYETGLLHFSEIKSPFLISGRFGYYINGKGKIMDNSIFKEKEIDDEISR